MLSRYRSSCRSVYNCFACILFTRRCISSSEIVPFSRTRACSSLLFIISRSSSFCRYSVSTEASSSLRRGSPLSTESPGFLYTSRIRVLIGVTMISSWQRHQFARCADADLDRAPGRLFGEKFVLMQVVSQYSGQNEQRGRRRGSRDGEPQQSFQHFLFFTSAGISRSIFCLLYGV